MTLKPAPRPAELPPEKLRWRCDSARIPFATTAQAEPREGVIGQERALRALKMGVELSAPGYNMFVCGLAGTSRGGRHQPRRHDFADDRGNSAGHEVFAGPLLRP